jgi:hypothetical protein
MVALPGRRLSDRAGWPDLTWALPERASRCDRQAHVERGVVNMGQAQQPGSPGGRASGLSRVTGTASPKQNLDDAHSRAHRPERGHGTRRGVQPGKGTVIGGVTCALRLSLLPNRRCRQGDVAATAAGPRSPPAGPAAWAAPDPIRLRGGVKCNFGVGWPYGLRDTVKRRRRHGDGAQVPQLG